MSGLDTAWAVIRKINTHSTILDEQD